MTHLRFCKHLIIKAITIAWHFTLWYCNDSQMYHLQSKSAACPIKF